MAYQTFPWQQGASRSFEKLLSLRLPSLRGKSVLDVGCNTGYFCGWAAFQKAARVRGVDSDPGFIALAKDWFPDCFFSCAPWRELGPECYDLILCLSAIHYAEDQQELLDLLMTRLNPGGLLVLELGVAPGEEDRFVEVTRAIDTRLFPTRARLHGMLAKYAFKHIGQSVSQSGDPIPRHVYHVQHALPLAILLMDEHYSGKTSVSSAILRPDIFRIQGEILYHDIADGRFPVRPELKELMRYIPGTRHMNPPSITQAICEAGLLPDMVSVYTTLARGGDFILDHYIPPQYRTALADILHESGFFVVDIAMYPAHKKPWIKERPPYAHYEAYAKYLQRISAIDEAAYLAANPDVAKAVAEGSIPSGRYHYWNFGRREKRKRKP